MPPQGLGALHAQQTNTQPQLAKENAVVKEEQLKERSEKKLQVSTASPFSAPAPATPTKQVTLRQDSANHSNSESAVENAEREQRRRQRVEKKLSEMQREEQQENRKSRLDGRAGSTAQGGQAAGMALSMLEFAQLHFAKHPKEFYQSSQTTQVMRTLTRRRRTVANVEALPFEEMVAFCKHGAIPSAHMASITDTELLQLSVSNFKDLCKFVRGELSAEGEVLFIQTVCQLAIEHESLRDELLVQACRQATANPLGHDSLRRIWLLIAACIGCFKPSKILHKVSTTEYASEYKIW